MGRGCLRATKASIYFVLTMATPARRAHYGAQYLLTTEGDTFERSLDGFAATPAGARLVAERPDIFVILQDRQALRDGPVGSVGRRYAAFMDERGFDETYYRGEAVAAAEREGRDTRHAWYRIRSGALHDLMHLVSGYDTDALGEACLMSFRYAQTRHPGLLAFVALMLVETLLFRGRVGVGAVREAYRRGRVAARLEWAAWEELLALPLPDLRAALGLSRPRVYVGGVAVDAYEGVRPAGSPLLMSAIAA